MVEERVPFEGTIPFFGEVFQKGPSIRSRGKNGLYLRTDLSCNFFVTL